VVDLRSLLAMIFEKGASDLHLTVGAPPMMRLDGVLKPCCRDVLTPEISREMVYSILNSEQRAKFEDSWELDLSVSLEGIGRFRVNVHRQRGVVEAAFRAIPDKIRSLTELGLPNTVLGLTRKTNGLILVTGPTGMGKTTTLAAMLDQINSERNCLIITIEDPIEYVLYHRKGIVKQREVGSDTHSFANGLRHILRQDPDVICIGEMRDLETISTAITAAETGHLVLATLHTPNVPQTIDRIIDVFPSNQQEQIRVQLAACLEGVIAQQLIPKQGGGRVMALELMVVTPAIRNIVRQQKTEQLLSMIQSGGELGMITMDNSLISLYQQGYISYEDALTRSNDPRTFHNTMMQKNNASAPPPQPKRFFGR